MMEKEKAKMPDEQNVMASVFCQTYNQKDYIRDALEGFVSQRQILLGRYLFMTMHQQMVHLILFGSMRIDIQNCFAYT